MKNKGAVLWIGLQAAGLSAVWAGNNGWFTSYNSEVERGEVELMFMNDFTSPSKFRKKDDGLGQYFSHMIELEYGLTDQLASEFMIESFEDVTTHQMAFTGFRWESRYRLFHNRVPFNPMVYAEYENLDPRTRYKMEVSGWVRPPYREEVSESDRERIMETRLILSDKAGPFDWTFNWINESDLDAGKTAFGYSLGLMWMGHDQHDPKADESASCRCPSEMAGCRCAHCHHGAAACPCGHKGMMGVGLEIFGGLGDTRRFGIQPSRQEHYVGPILVYHINGHWMAHAQLANGLSHASDNLVRLNLGYEF